MRKLPFLLIILLIISLMACKETKNESLKPKVEQRGEQFSEYYILFSSNVGPSRNNIAQKEGLILLIEAVNNEIRLVNEELNIDQVFPKGVIEKVYVVPDEPGNYNLLCVEGCEVEDLKITVKIFE